MMTYFNKWIQKIDLKTAIIATVIFSALLWLIDYSPLGVAALQDMTGGVGILDYETRYSAEYACRFLDSMTAAGRHFHLTRIMPLDIIYPPSLMACMFCWLSLILKKTTKEASRLRCFLVLPILYLVLDYAENIGITAMLLSYPARLDIVAVMTGIITSVKKTVVLGVIIVFAACLLILAYQQVKCKYGQTKKP